MIRLDEVRARIEARVADLAGRIGNAGEFGRLVANNQLPVQTPAGFVLPGSLTGGNADASAGAFTQAFEESVIVVLAVRVAGDATGAAAVDELTPLINDVVNAVCGYSPADAPGTYVLRSGELVGSKDATLVYQLEFSLQDQLRIFA